MAASGSTDYAWRVGRTAFLNTLGYTPISSQKEVEKVRKRILAVNKEDWAVLKMNMYIKPLKIYMCIIPLKMYIYITPPKISYIIPPHMC